MLPGGLRGRNHCRRVHVCVRNDNSDAPYSPTKEWVDYLVREHQVDFILHGDDPCLTVCVCACVCVCVCVS